MGKVLLEQGLQCLFYCSLGLSLNIEIPDHTLWMKMLIISNPLHIWLYYVSSDIFTFMNTHYFCFLFELSYIAKFHTVDNVIGIQQQKRMLRHDEDDVAPDQPLKPCCLILHRRIFVICILHS